jgi:hypothetical protein
MPEIRQRVQSRRLIISEQKVIHAMYRFEELVALLLIASKRIPKGYVEADFFPSASWIRIPHTDYRTSCTSPFWPSPRILD